MIPRTEKPEVRLDTMIAIWGDCPKAIFMCAQFGFQYYNEELITSDEMLQCWNECKQHAINSANAETIQKLETQIAEYQKLLPNVVILPQQAQSGATNPKGTETMSEKKLSKKAIKKSQEIDGMFPEPLEITNKQNFWADDDDFIGLHPQASHGHGIDMDHPCGSVKKDVNLLWCGNKDGRPIFMTSLENEKPYGALMGLGIYFLGCSGYFEDNAKEAKRLTKLAKERSALFDSIKKQNPDDFAEVEQDSTCTDANEKTGTLGSAVSSVFKGRRPSGGRTRRSPVDAGTNTGLAMAGGAIGAGVLLGGGSDCGGSFGGGSSGGFDGGGSFGGGCGGD